MFNINIDKKVVPEYNVNRITLIQKRTLTKPIQPTSEKVVTQRPIPSELEQISECLFEIY